jgi:hypothetical protein
MKNWFKIPKKSRQPPEAHDFFFRNLNQFFIIFLQNLPDPRFQIKLEVERWERTTLANGAWLEKKIKNKKIM